VTIFEQTLRDVLIAANLTAKRVYLIRAPQVGPAGARYGKSYYDKATYDDDASLIPYMLFFHLAPVPHYYQSGPIQTLDREYQISIFHTSQSTALAMADTLREYLDSFRGDYENVRFFWFQLRNQTHQYETDTKLFQIVQEWRIMFAMMDALTTRKPAVPTRSNTRSNTRSSRSLVYD
jgi:hypothetical protein